eukprot:scaffold874_cov95-Isochrysis_galbana.AAC.5
MPPTHPLPLQYWAAYLLEQALIARLAALVAAAAVEVRDRILRWGVSTEAPLLTVEELAPLSRREARGVAGLLTANLGAGQAPRPALPIAADAGHVRCLRGNGICKRRATGRGRPGRRRRSPAVVGQACRDVAGKEARGESETGVVAGWSRCPGRWHSSGLAVLRKYRASATYRCSGLPPGRDALDRPLFVGRGVHVRLGHLALLPARHILSRLGHYLKAGRGSSSAWAARAAAT